MRVAPLVLAGAAVAGPWLPATAEPYLAVRTGLACGSCHVNRTGGGERTAYGAQYGAATLPSMKFPAGGKLFDGAIGERVRLGADLRGGYLGHLREDGPYLGEIRMSEANLYLGVDLLPERLTAYIDERVAPGGATCREAFALYSARRGGFYAKAGKFFLPYGLRLQDDDAATRRGTGFTFESSDLGLELGGSGEHWTAALSVSNGTAGAAEQDNDKQYVGTGAWIHRDGRVGVSVSANDLPGAAHRTLAGAFGGYQVAPLVVLAEIDRIVDTDVHGRDTRGAAGHVEVDVAAARGVTARAWGGAYDLDRADGVSRFAQWGAGVDWTALPGLQLRLLYRNRSGPAETQGSSDAEAIAEVHIFF